MAEYSVRVRPELDGRLHLLDREVVLASSGI